MKFNYIIVTFFTTAGAMAFETACKKHAIAGKLISAPRILTADCGIAWRSSAELRPELEQLISDMKLETDTLTEMEL